MECEFKKHWIALLITNLILLNYSQIASAAPTVIFDANKTGCSTLYQSAIIFGNRFYSSSNTTITAINVSIGNGTTANFSSSRYYVMSDSAGVPGTVLSTFNPNVISGSGTMTIAQFTGSYTINAGTFIWFIPAQYSNVLAQCYANSVWDATMFSAVGINVDTSTSGSNTSWPRAYTTASSPIGATWNYQGNTPLVWQISLESAPSTPVTVSLTLSGGGASAIYRTTTVLTASVNTASSVTFYQSGKRIPGCINIKSSAGVSSCNWKPSRKGISNLSATAKPTAGGYLQGSSSNLAVSVTPRTLTH